jgi:hypothetical protein
MFRTVAAGAGALLLASLGWVGVGLGPAGALPTGGDNTGTSQPLPPEAGESYSLLTDEGSLLAFGGAFGDAGPDEPPSPAVGVAPTRDGQGALVAEADGTVVATGDASYHGSEPSTSLDGQVVGIAADTATGGYWLATSNGAVYAFDAPEYGSASEIDLHHPVVGITAGPGGDGYWLVASDGGVFSFGKVDFYGSTGSIHLNRPIVGIASTPDGEGYWLVASDGGVFSFGQSRFFGSTGGIKLKEPIVGMATTSSGNGYWLAAADGGVFTFGRAAFFGSAAVSDPVVIGIVLETGGYSNPLRAIKDLVRQRVDQGVDYGGGGPIYAIGDGIVLNTTNSGWPGSAFITYQLLDGRAEGDIVYVAENVTPLVKIGQQVTPDTVVGDLINQSPNLETGWAAPPGTGESLALASGQWSSYDDEHSVPTAYGENFSQLLSALGAPPGISYAKPSGKIAADWPTWSND